METITIPKKLSKGRDLIVIPRKEYEALLRVHKSREGFYDELDKDLKKAIKSYKKGSFYGPFLSVKESKKFLDKEIKRKK